MSARRQAGFTLLEMLLAIGLLVLLAGLAYSTLRTSVRSWEAADTQADREDALRVGWPFLHQTLAAARAERDPDERNAIRFNGDATQLSWVAELPAHFAAGGPRLLTLTTADDPRRDRRQLVLRSGSLDPDQVAVEDAQQAVLVDHLQEIVIQYYGADDDGAPRWQSVWQQRRSLPQLVRIDIRPADAPAWPSLYAHPYLAGPPPIAEQAAELPAEARD